MENGVNRDGISRRLIENLEGEATDGCASKLIHGNRIYLRVTLDALHTGFDTAKEVLPQSRLATLIPTVGLSHILLSFGGENNALNHAVFAPGA